MNKNSDEKKPHLDMSKWGLWLLSKLPLSFQQQRWFFCTGGHGTVPYEQYTQQSPFLGLSIISQFVQA